MNKEICSRLKFDHDDSRFGIDRSGAGLGISRSGVMRGTDRDGAGLVIGRDDAEFDTDRSGAEFDTDRSGAGLGIGRDDTEFDTDRSGAGLGIGRDDTEFDTDRSGAGFVISRDYAELDADRNGAGNVQKAVRIWEIDVLRGIAIILMVFFHTLVDLRDFFGYDIAYFAPPWRFVGMASAITFMLVSGASCNLSTGNIKRGIKVFLVGMVVTVATFIFVRELYIRFGVLHFLGASMILWGVMDRLISSGKAKLAILSLCFPVFIIIGYYFGQMRIESPYLFFLGLITTEFASYDYYPLFPWFGVFAAGGVVGALLYKSKRASVFKFGVEDVIKPAKYVIKGLAELGKKSLLIYVIHQPALMAVLWIAHALIGIRG
ncbi:MAG: DUF1624 domain-containing protein [Oscillospiraceae bacterium]|nr:DUF1624 domain-containing protein [Oscillospiraceae bacterium]